MTDIVQVIHVGTPDLQDPLTDLVSTTVLYEGPVLEIPKATFESLHFLIAVHTARHHEIILDMTGCIDSTLE